MFLLGVFAPGIVAFALTERAEGRAATRALVARVFKWDVGVRWYVFAIAYIPAIKLVVALVHRIVTGAWPRFGEEPLYLMASVSPGLDVGAGWRRNRLARVCPSPSVRALRSCSSECHPWRDLCNVALAAFLFSSQ